MYIPQPGERFPIMLIHHSYIKPRSQFGKQCFFEDTESIVQENILPDPELMRDYIRISHCHRGVQMSKQFALHEIQPGKITKESGMLHLEGGWPKEINVKNDEAVLRFRRRMLKHCAPKMKRLTVPMECCILQNNAINIYENYFDYLVPTRLDFPRKIRTSNMYADPQPIVRPINHLSWSPDAQNRLAAAYSFMEFETKPPNVNSFSYVWDIENPNAPVICLKSSSPLIIVEFNSNDPSMLISGLMSGQVCNWDIRIGDRPVQMSPRRFSHRYLSISEWEVPRDLHLPAEIIGQNLDVLDFDVWPAESQISSERNAAKPCKRNPANQALWIQSKTNTNFFSASIDGTIKWWDIRMIRRPINELVMDLDNPLQPDIIHATGVTKLQYEPTMRHKFLAGMENGMVINVRRKLAPVDRLAIRLNCHIGPVLAIDRSPFAMKNFLTVGDWTVKIWTESNAKTSSLLSTRSRYSEFFTINATGLLEVYDILNGLDSPVTTHRVCNESLTVIAPHKNGQLLAIGSHNGNICLVECSEGHMINTKTDKADLTAYLERCRRFEKTVDLWLKERFLRQDSVHEDSVEDHSLFISKNRHKKKNEGENKNKAHIKEEGEYPKKKSRARKLEKDHIFFEELAEAEMTFFQTVKKEFESYPEIHQIQEIPRKEKRIVHESVAVEDKSVKIEQKQSKAVREKTRAAKPKTKPSSPTSFLIKEMEVDKEEDEERAVTALEVPFVKPKKTLKKHRGEEILSKVCAIEVCKPEICCADLEEKRKAELRTQLASKEKKSSWVITQRRHKLFDLEQKLPEHSSVGKRRTLLEEDESLANVFADEVEEARREMRAWQKRIALGKRDSLRPEMIEVVHENSEGKKKEVEKGDVESPVRSAEEERSDFRQLVETTSKWKSVIEDKTLQARGKRNARKLESQLEKYAQKEETYPTLSAYTDESTEAITMMSTKHE